MKRLFAVIFVLCLMFAFACDDGQEELMTATNEPTVEDTVAPTIVGIHESNCLYYDPPNVYYDVYDGSTLHHLGYFITIKISEKMDFDRSEVLVYKIAGSTTLVQMGEYCLDDETVFRIRPINPVTGLEANWEASTTYLMQGVIFDKAGNSVVLGPMTFYTGI